MNNFLVFLSISIGIAGCSSVPTNQLDVSKGIKSVPVEFPDDSVIDKSAQFSILVRYDQLKEDAPAKKQKLQEGFARGVQTIFSIPSFVAKTKTTGSVRFESMTENYRDKTCYQRSLEIIEDEWKLKNAGLIRSACKVEALNGGGYFVGTDVVLQDSSLKGTINRESGFYKPSREFNWKTYGDELTVISAANLKEPIFEMGGNKVSGLYDGNRRLTILSFHPHKQNYISKVAFSYGPPVEDADRISGSVLHSIIGGYKIGDVWSPIIPNLNLVKKLRHLVPQITKEEYNVLALRVEDKLEKFELARLVQKCNQNDLADICLARAPKDYDENVTKNSRLPMLMKKYFEQLGSVTKSYEQDMEQQRLFSWRSGFEAPVSSTTELSNLHELKEISSALEAAIDALNELWGVILLDHTEITPVRDGDTVKLEFKIDLKAALNAYKMTEI